MPIQRVTTINCMQVPYEKNILNLIYTYAHLMQMGPIIICLTIIINQISMKSRNEFFFGPPYLSEYLLNKQQSGNVKEHDQNTFVFPLLVSKRSKYFYRDSLFTVVRLSPRGANLTRCGGWIGLQIINDTTPRI